MRRVGSRPVKALFDLVEGPVSVVAAPQVVRFAGRLVTLMACGTRSLLDAVFGTDRIGALTCPPTSHRHPTHPTVDGAGRP
jgi:hypothetical protein